LQPVATGNPRVLSDLVQGRTRPDDIGPSAYHSLRSWLNHTQLRAAERLRQETQGRSDTRARRALRSYRTQGALILWALLARTPDEFHLPRDHPDHHRRLQALLAEALSVMPSLRNLQQVPVGRLVPQRKPNGDYRPVIEYEWPQQAKFRLLASSLEPLVGFHASQFLYQENRDQRGLQAAYEALRDALRGVAGDAADYAFAELDIRDCFGSISEEWWTAQPLLDNDMRVQAYVGRHRVEISSRARARLGAATELSVRRGFPQGSALSTLLSEWVIADVLQGLSVPSGVSLFTYCDNIGVLAPKAQLEAIKELIRGVFSTSRAGCFLLRDKTSITPANRPIRFLGMEFRVEGDDVHIAPPDYKRETREIILARDLAAARSEEAFAHLRSKVSSAAANWRLWDGSEAWRESQHLMISLERSRWRGLRRAALSGSMVEVVEQGLKPSNLGVGETAETMG
jgi:RNA-directed DNA polymerase